jgi:hypothetical protein
MDERDPHSASHPGPNWLAADTLLLREQGKLLCLATGAGQLLLIESNLLSPKTLIHTMVIILFVGNCKYRYSGHCADN